MTTRAKVSSSVWGNTAGKYVSLQQSQHKKKKENGPITKKKRIVITTLLVKERSVKWKGYAKGPTQRSV